MRTEPSVRELSEDCFNNFWEHFNQEFQRKTFSLKTEAAAPKKVHDRIKAKTLSIAQRWQTGQSQGVALEFWQLVGTARKFLKNLN